MSRASKIRIKLKSFDHRLLDRSSVEIVDTAKRTGARVAGPVPLPTHISRYCVLRSPHVDKNSREHFEVRVHKRILEIYYDPEVPIFDLLADIDLAPGIFYRICLS